MHQPAERDRWITQDDNRLLSECHVDTYRASGPGGQKRNKTSSAVRLRHRPSGVIAISEESRSQHENKARALKRLRMSISLEVREAIDHSWEPPAVYQKHHKMGRLEISRRNPEYPVLVAIVLDVVAAGRGNLREAAVLLRLKTAQLSKFIVSEGKVLAAVNRIRHEARLRPLSAESKRPNRKRPKSG